MDPVIAPLKASATARITIFQLLIWFAGGAGFLLTQVDRQGQYVSVPMAILYVVLCIGAMVAVAVKLGQMTFSRACMSPGMLLIELAVLTGNATPWVIAEPAMLAAIGNVSIYRRDGAPAPLPAPSVVHPSSVQSTSGGAEAPPLLLHLQQNVRSAGTGNQTAVICVGGIGGGFDSPAKGLYGRLAEVLPKEHVAVYDLAFRRPGDLAMCIADVRGCIGLARAEGTKKIVLIGHSFGGGVVVSAALDEPAVQSVILLSTQTTGCERVAELGPRVSVRLMHGFFDYINPRYTSENVHRMSKAPKSLRLVCAGHLLDEAAGEVFSQVRVWITDLANLAN